MHTDRESTPIKKTARQKRKPKKITPTYLHNAGLYYLGRYATSGGNFRTVMTRKINKSCTAHPEQNRDECMVMLDELIKTFYDSGLLDDESYIRGKVETLKRQGRSVQYMIGKLTEKNLPKDMIHEYLTPLKTQDYQTEAAMIFARKKRVFQKDLDDPDTYRKVMGQFARAGFSYETVRAVLNTAKEDEASKPFDTAEM